MDNDSGKTVAAEAAEPLRLAVVDDEDLAVVSAHLQDAEVSLSDMAYLPGPKRFAFVCDRFDWSGAVGGRFERCVAGLHFERVLKVARSGIPSDRPATKRRLLAISFLLQDAPSGVVLLTFADGGLIRLTVECLEAEMRDMGPRWTVAGRPDSPLDAGRVPV